MSEQVRIAYIVHTFDVGGLERCVSHVVNRLDRSRWMPLVICLNRNGTASKWITREDVRIIEVGSRGGFDWRGLRRFARLLKEERVDLVQSHNWGTLVETELARRSAGVRHHVHAERGTVMGGTTGGSRFRHWVRGTCMRWALRCCNSTIAVAEAVRDRVTRMTGYPASRILIVPNGVEPPACSDPAGQRTEIRKALGVGSQAVLIGSVGRLVPVKNFQSLIAATVELLRADRDVHLALVGDGPEQEMLEQLVRDSGISGRIHLVGAKSNVGDWLSAFDVYVNCSLSEGMSQSLLEAMSFGLPLVVTDAGDNRILAEGCGHVVPVGAVSELGEELGELCSTPGTRRSLGRNARDRHRQQYSIEKMIERYDELYSAVISGRPGARDPAVRCAAATSAPVPAFPDNDLGESALRDARGEASKP